MEFQIFDKDGKPLSMGELDAQAAQIWNKKIDKKSYAHPYEEVQLNPSDYESFSEYLKAKFREQEKIQLGSWFQVIGLTIAVQQDDGNYRMNSWDKIVYDLTASQLHKILIDKDENGFKMYDFTSKGNEIHLCDDIEYEMFSFKNFIQPYLKLINYWEDKGYTPCKIEN